MSKGRSSHFGLLIPMLIIGVSVLSSTPHGQSPDSEKPKLKQFGSSLKRMAWDPVTNAAVERKPDAKKDDEPDVVRVETSLVVCDVLVVDKQGRAVQSLSQNDFLVTEDKQLQQVGMFSLGDNATVPRSIVLIIDYSPSQFPYLKTSIEAAKTMVDKLGPRDRMAIVTDDVELLVEFTQDKKKLKEKLESLLQRAEPRHGLFSSRRQHLGHSAQYSALMATLKEMFDAEDVRPIIIFQTDGDEAYNLQNPIVVPSIPPNLPPDLQKEAELNVDAMQRRRENNLTTFSLGDIYKSAEKSRATIYTIIPGFRIVGLTLDEQIAQMKAETERAAQEWSAAFGSKTREQMRAQAEDRWQRTPVEALRYRAAVEGRLQSALVVLSTLTGGWTEFLQDPAQADDIYSRIFADIDRRYIIGYYPSNKEHDGKRRRVGVEVRGHPDYVVLGRR